MKAKQIEWREEHDGIHRGHIYHNGYVSLWLVSSISYNELTKTVSDHTLYMPNARSVKTPKSLQEEKERAQRLFNSYVNLLLED